MSLSTFFTFKKTLFSTLISTALSSSAWASSPPLLSSDITWVDSGGAGLEATYSSVNDIETSFNHARRQEENQLGLAANTIANLVLPSQTIWDKMSDDAKTLYILNNERVSRSGMAPGIIGLPFSGIEASIDAIATNYSTLLHDTNQTGPNQPSGDSSIDRPSLRIDQNPVIGAARECHEGLARNESLAYFTAYSADTMDATSIPLPIERAIFSWIYADAKSGWRNRETVLLQDLGGDEPNTKGFNNNHNGDEHEGFIGVHRIGSTDYQPFTTPDGLNNYGVAVVLNIFDPVSDSDALSRGCEYNVTLRTEDLPKPKNRVPLAIDDSVTTPFNTTTHPIAVLDNDSDPDDEPLTITEYTDPVNGSLVKEDDTFIYTPNDGFSGADSFTYTISDGNFEETTATATATAIAIYSPEGILTDTNTFTFTISDGNGGVATADSTGTAVITNNPDDVPNSTETFTFTISNALNGEAIATATATASASNEDATATATATAIAIYTPDTIISVTDSFTYTISIGEGEASAEADAAAIATVEFTPKTEPGGESSFTYTVIDDNGEEFTATTIAMAMATATATVTALTAETANVSIDVAENVKPSFTLSQTSYETNSDAGKMYIPGWVEHAEDGEGGTQLPNGGDSSDVIYFHITSNSNSALFTEQPWVSYPSHSLHFTPERDAGGTAEVCMKAVDWHGNGLSSDIQCFDMTINQIPNHPPSLSIKQPAQYVVDADAGKVTVPGWVVEAADGDGGTQLPHGGDSTDIIHFNITSNSNPELFNEQPWISYPSQSLHFTPAPGSYGSSELCAIATDRGGEGASSTPVCFTITVIDPTPPSSEENNSEEIPDATVSEPTDNLEGDSSTENSPVVISDAQSETENSTTEPEATPNSNTPETSSETKDEPSQGGGSFGVTLIAFLLGLGLFRRKRR